MTSEALLLSAALAGYLVGSISFARVVGRIVLPGQDLSAATLQYDESGAIEVEGVSATSVSVRAGRRWGLLVSLLDIAKAARGHRGLPAGSLQTSRPISRPPRSRWSATSGRCGTASVAASGSHP